MRRRSEVHVATPQPKKSVSSVQIGHRSASAQASMGQSSGSSRASRSRASFSNSPYTSPPINSTKRPRDRKKDERFLGIAPVLRHKSRQVLFGFGECGFGNKEKNVFRVRLDHFACALPENGTHEDVGVNHQRFAWHFAFSRGQTGVSVCTRPSVPLLFLPTTRSSHPDL